MRAVFTNFGTQGDFFPLCALAERARHESATPVFAVPPFADSIIRQFDFPILHVGDDLAVLRDAVNRFWVTQKTSLLDADLLWNVLRPFQQHLERAFEQLLEACHGADVLISGPAQPLARTVHEYLGIPFVSVQFSHFGGSGGAALARAGDLLINPFRLKLGLPAIKDPFTNGANSPQLALYAMSPHLRPRHHDWPSHYHLTGFWFTSETTRTDESLKTFIEGGAPPVVITFGSMASTANIDIQQLGLDLAASTSRRVVLQEVHPKGRITDDVFSTGYISHSWLFPRASCVVLHGGAGTTASVFRAGIPGIFVPHASIFDQEYWARLAFEAHCAPRPIPVSLLTSESLAIAAQESIGNDTLRRHASNLGELIRRERGVANAWKLIESLVQRLGLI